MNKNNPIMIFNISIEPALISEMSSVRESPAFIPFTGKVESDLFSGTILPGAVDVQVTDPAGCRHMCAKYMFRGTDMEGNACMLFVENNGYVRPSDPAGTVVQACPRFITDSPALREYLSQARFRTEVHPSGTGVDILVYDTALEE